MDERRIVTTDGNERVINSTVIGKLASDLRGELLCPATKVMMPPARSGTA
jgi:hypothetical protein